MRSNDRFRTLVETIARHAQDLVDKKPADKVTPIEGAAGKYTGCPLRSCGTG
jgi:hypothetical protein